MKRKDLPALVGNQKSRFFRPVEGVPVIAAERVRTDDGTVATAALAELELLERLEAALERCGRRVRSIRPACVPEQPAPRLLTRNAQAAKRRHTLATLLAATAVAMGGWVAAATAYVVDLRADGRAVAIELAELEAPLERMDALSRRLAAFAPVAEAFRSQSADSAWALQRIAGLTAALPPEAHLHRVSTERRGGMVIEAHAPDALAVVEALGRWWPGAARLDGPPEPDALGDAGPQERFRVVLQRDGP